MYEFIRVSLFGEKQKFPALRHPTHYAQYCCFINHFIILKTTGNIERV